MWCLYSVSFAATTQEWWDILNQLRNLWRADNEIKVMMEDLWLDANSYFSNSKISSSNSYTSRSCKVYSIKYIDALWAYTSPDLNKKEYFINLDYFKRYVDSKNTQIPSCVSNEWRINTSYTDTSNSTESYTAPNWKMYFIAQKNWLYTSSELSVRRNFSTINELKTYIRDRNPLINMWTNNIQSIQHNSAGTGEEYKCNAGTLTNNLTNSVSFNIGDTDKKVVFDWTYTTPNSSTTIWWFSIYWDPISTGDSINFYVSINWKYFSEVTIGEYWNISVRESDNLIKIGTTANVKVEAKFNGTNYNKTYNYRISITPSDDCDVDWRMTNLAPIIINNRPKNLTIYEEQEIDYSDEAKKNRDITRKNDIAHIQAAIATVRGEKWYLPWTETTNNIATQWISIDKIAGVLESYGRITNVPFDPISTNVVDWLWNAKGVGEYIYLVAKDNWDKSWLTFIPKQKTDTWFALMAKTETADASNRIVCDGEKNIDNWYITSSTDLNNIQKCTSLIKSNSCFRDNQWRINSQKCYYSNENQLRYLLTF